MVQKDFKVIEKQTFPSGNSLLYLTTPDRQPLPPAFPGQFVQVKTECEGVMLRRPISICDFFDETIIALFVKPVGKGSKYIAERNIGDSLNIITPLGSGFSMVDKGKALLVGGGVGAAPLSFLCRELAYKGVDVSVAIGGRSCPDVKGISLLFNKANRLELSTEDGSLGQKGFVTENDIFDNDFDFIYCCGPTPMMRAVARIAKSKNIPCEVSLENQMACGLGACLCCVEKTDDKGNICVCTEGPVFNINRLESWI